jgi:hypothetical protein
MANISTFNLSTVTLTSYFHANTPCSKRTYVESCVDHDGTGDGRCSNAKSGGIPCIQDRGDANDPSDPHWRCRSTASTRTQPIPQELCNENDCRSGLFPGGQCHDDLVPSGGGSAAFIAFCNSRYDLEGYPCYAYINGCDFRDGNNCIHHLRCKAYHGYGKNCISPSPPPSPSPPTSPPSPPLIVIGAVAGGVFAASIAILAIYQIFYRSSPRRNARQDPQSNRESFYPRSLPLRQNA